MENYDYTTNYRELYQKMTRKEISKMLSDLSVFLVSLLDGVNEELDDEFSSKVDELITEIDKYEIFLQRGYFIFQETSDIIEYGGLDILLEKLRQERPNLAKKLVFASSIGDDIHIRLDNIEFNLNNYRTAKFELIYVRDDIEHTSPIDTNDIYMVRSSYPNVFTSSALNEILAFLMSFSPSTNYENERRMFYYDAVQEKFIFF